MRRICAWCKKVLTDEGLDVCDERVVSHGICRECAVKVVSQSGMSLQEFLDDLGVPVLVTEPDMNVRMASKQVREVLNNELKTGQGFRCGNVLNCYWAQLPEGCGNTICCPDCAIRQTVAQTFKSGQTILNRPAELNHHPSGQKIHLLISTELVGDIVLLRIDEVV